MVQRRDGFVSYLFQDQVPLLRHSVLVRPGDAPVVVCHSSEYNVQISGANQTTKTSRVIVRFKKKKTTKNNLPEKI